MSLPDRSRPPQPICSARLDPAGAYQPLSPRPVDAFPRSRSLRRSGRLRRGRSLRRWAHALLVAAAIWPVACSGGREAATPGGSGWQHTRTTEGSVTTVSTTAGSKWDAPAILEEELSIGVAAGDEPYMFGEVDSVWATDDAIWVVDRGVPAVRVYDHQGRWLRDVGSAGQGPGEYELPGQVIVTGDGRAIVGDITGRTNVYDAAGRPLSTWSPAGGGMMRIGGGTLLLRDDGSLWTRTTAMPSQQEMQKGGTLRIRQGMARLDDAGSPGEILEPPALGEQGAGMEMRTAGGSGGAVRMFSTSGGPRAPFMPSYLWTMAPNGDWVVGTAERYRFEIHHPDGSKTIVERFWDPVRVLDEEAAYSLSRIEKGRQRLDPEYRYDGPPVPQTKPAYVQIAVDRSGRIWVQRQGTGYHIDGCEDDEDQESVTSVGGGRIVMQSATTCWSAPVIRDVFDATGEYLGELIAPEGLTLGATYIENDLFLAVVEDEDGLVMVKKYRIVPGALR